MPDSELLSFRCGANCSFCLNERLGRDFMNEQFIFSANKVTSRKPLVAWSSLATSCNLFFFCQLEFVWGQRTGCFHHNAFLVSICLPLSICLLLLTLLKDWIAYYQVIMSSQEKLFMKRYSMWFCFLFCSKFRLFEIGKAQLWYQIIMTCLPEKWELENPCLSFCLEVFWQSGQLGLHRYWKEMSAPSLVCSCSSCLLQSD